MTYDEFNAFCSSLPATSYVMQWGESHVWKVGGKVFAIGGWEIWKTPAFSFKTSELHFNLLKDEPGYRPAPYMAARGLKWIQQCDDAREKDDALKYYLQSSYQLVIQGFSKKKQKELGLI